MEFEGRVEVSRSRKKTKGGEKTYHTHRILIPQAIVRDMGLTEGMRIRVTIQPIVKGRG